jgi:superoxide dismutase, Fe-Mn family
LVNEGAYKAILKNNLFHTIKKMKFYLPQLPFELNALEPNISEKTLEFHYGKHHQAYLTNLNSLITGTKFENSDLITLIKVAEGPLFNNASQVWNHSFFFESLIGAGKNELKGPFADIIIDSFGSLSIFKETFIKASLSLFGSGWVWLVWNPKGSIEIIQESNAGNPLRKGLIPLLACDVWEHSYYIDYQNRRSDYLNAFWALVNWEFVERRLNDARK